MTIRRLPPWLCIYFTRVTKLWEKLQTSLRDKLVFVHGPKVKEYQIFLNEGVFLVKEMLELQPGSLAGTHILKVPPEKEFWSNIIPLQTKSDTKSEFLKGRILGSRIPDIFFWKFLTFLVGTEIALEFMNFQENVYLFMQIESMWPVLS